MTDRKPNGSQQGPAPTGSTGAPPASKAGVQGEGDYISARRYQQDAAEFVKQHDTGQLARDAAPKDEAEARELLEAERQGLAKAKGRKPGNSPSNR